MTHQLTDRQHRILTLTANGHDIDDIAAREHLSRETVSRNRRKINQLLGARNRTHAVAIALTTGILQPANIHT